MKINTGASFASVLNLVRSKQEHGSSQGQEHGQEQPHPDSSNPEQDSSLSQNEHEEQETHTRQLGEAVESFRSEVTQQANGLDVTTEGAGPGLKVVLKDQRGSVVRSFTGEEFMKLRNAAHQEGRQCGKILDQKL